MITIFSPAVGSVQLIKENFERSRLQRDRFAKAETIPIYFNGIVSLRSGGIMRNFFLIIENDSLT